jgi:hypothetical protein
MISLITFLVLFVFTVLPAVIVAEYSAVCPWSDYCGADSFNITGPGSACFCSVDKPHCGPAPWFNCLTQKCSTDSIDAPANGVKGTCSVSSIASGSSCAISCNEGFSVTGKDYTCTGNTITGSQTCLPNPPAGCTCRWSNFCGVDSCGHIGGNSACRCRSGDQCTGSPTYNCGLTNNSKPYSNVDLILDKAKFLNSIYFEDRTFDRTGCAFEEGIIDEVGPRKLLRFATQIHNIGSEDFVLGDPTSDQNKELFQWSACHGHFHLEGWSDYVLLNKEGNVVGIGHKQGFCIRDSYRYGGRQTMLYSCDNQGLSADWGDLYENNIDGQWIDITGIAPGDYTLKLTVNPYRRFAEANFDNNSVQTIVNLK